MRIIRELIIMSSTAYLDRARGWTKLLEDKEAERTGVRLTEARPAVSRRIGVPPGTLENLRNGRLKAIAVHWYDRLRAGVVKELEAEVRHLEHELQILRTTGVDPREDEVAAVVADLAKVRQALGLPGGAR